MVSKTSAIQLSVVDNVATATSDLSRGACVILACPCDETRSLVLQESVPFGHKFAICDIAAGAPVVKYGEEIGTATVNILRGAWVHTHNVQGNRANEKARRAP